MEENITKIKSDFLLNAKNSKLNAIEKKIFILNWSWIDNV